MSRAPEGGSSGAAGGGTSPLDRVAAVLRLAGLAGIAVLLGISLVGVAVGQLVGLGRVGEAGTVLPVLVVVAGSVAVVLAVGLRGARSTDTPYW